MASVAAGERCGAGTAKAGGLARIRLHSVSVSSWTWLAGHHDRWISVDPHLVDKIIIGNQWDGE